MKYLATTLILSGAALLYTASSSAEETSASTKVSSATNHEVVLEDYQKSEVYETTGDAEQSQLRRSTRMSTREDFDNCDYDETHEHYHCNESSRSDSSSRVTVYQDGSKHRSSRRHYRNERYSDRNSYQDRQWSNNLALGIGIGLPLLLNHATYDDGHHNRRHNRRHHNRNYYGWYGNHRNEWRHNKRRHHRHSRHCGHH